ncbi:GNAT family N-acetyltransferase [Natrinema sp. 1APR25-10V2]|uniref:GNAT family N-acetyltransferase n=1 Tax=Natrinema sp. 1APR25-10V2 TaxID=2951081 RepID=UPI0028764D01|nr:GNAT family N-acetyltransferase [Natrinema sp. 1APR25-10V2]MDS0476522.1 GNAT family N-acetyltransferase [Natrinema sp. 1APR25-10V2]
MNTTQRTATRYAVRGFEPADQAAFLSLYETVFGHERSRDWFRWKFRENPYADHVPIVVATVDGEPIGFRSFFAQEMRIGGAVRTAFQPCDTMVHADHREQGLFGRMNEHAIDRYADGPPSFFFNFPNENSKPGNLAHGWQEIGTVPAYYRPQNPVGVLEDRTDDDSSSPATDPRAADGRRIAALADALEGAIATSHRAGDRLLVGSDGALEIERYETPPAETLETVYRRSVPDEIHTNRTASFYRWRFANPARTYAAYVARRDGEPVAALVTSSTDEYTRIVETLPRTLEDVAGLERLLVAALDDHADRGYAEAFGETLPAPLRFRFYPDTRLPLSALLQPTARTLLARDLGDGLGLESSSIDAWSFSRLDLDTT